MERFFATRGLGALVSIVGALAVGACGESSTPPATTDDVGTDAAGGDTTTAGDDGLADTGGAPDVAVDDTGSTGDSGTFVDAPADTLGDYPKCGSSSECTNATVKVGAAIDSPTTCAHEHCGLATPDNRTGAAGTKTPLSCDAICAAATYEGRPMACAPICRTITSTGFGDQVLLYDNGPPADAGVDAGPVSFVHGGLAQFIFGSTTLHTSRYRTYGCAETPPKTITSGSNTFKYESQHCCCIAGKK